MTLRLLLISSFSLLFRFNAFPQAGMWTWVKGSNTGDAVGTFGTQGIEDPANNPPGFYEACEWTDTAGNFWLFGGQGIDGTYGDTWKFNPVTGNWIWMSGTGTGDALPVYGTIGVPSASNQPGGRERGIPTWTDSAGNLWLYGGLGEDGDVLNDMWRYNIGTNTWTWMQGSQIGNANPVYGTMGVEAAANTPGGRDECAATWTDTAGNLWLYGGNTGDYTEFFGDLWRYNVVTNNWTWMSGSNQLNTTPVYGTEGVASAGNMPGGRMTFTSWIDGNGNFWMYAGSNDEFAVNYNDMWMYNPSTGLWAWMAGTSIENNYGNYGTQCTSETGLESSARVEARTRWTDACGNFWFYGGGRSGALDTDYNDLWYFSPVSLKWTFVNGSSSYNATPVYGTMGIAAAGNTPGGRSGALPWISKTGALYLFGGFVIDAEDCNDVWEYIIDSACGNIGTPPDVDLGDDTSYCGAFSRVLSTNSATAVWSTGATGAQITVTQPGEYWVSVTGCGATVVDSVALGVLNLGSPFYFGPDTTYCSAGFSRVLTTGYANSVWSTGDTGSQITVSVPGVYWATVSNSCGTLADTIRIAQNNVTVQPGPISTTCGESNGVATVIITTGNAPFTYKWDDGSTTDSLTGLSPGIYKFTVTDRAGCTASDSDLVNSQAPSVTLMSSSTNICPGDSATICAPSGYDSYLWNDGEGTQCITATLAGNYYVTVIDNSGCTAASDNIQLNVLSPPPVIINITGDTLRAFNSTTYQWYYDGVAIPGDTTSVIIAHNGGSYSVAVSDTNGCLIMSNNINITGINNLAEATSLKVYPDPATDELNISYQLNSAANLQLCLTDIIGRRITNILDEEELSGNYLQRVNIRNLASAVYILTFTTESGRVNVRFVKE